MKNILMTGNEDYMILLKSHYNYMVKLCTNICDILHEKIVNYRRCVRVLKYICIKLLDYCKNIR